MHTSTTIELLRSIAMDILLFGGVLTMAVFFILLVFVLRGVLKTMKLINHLNEIFVQLNTVILRVMDPLESFVSMLRLSMKKEVSNKASTVKQKKKTSKPAKKNTQKTEATKKITKKTNKKINKKNK